MQLNLCFFSHQSTWETQARFSVHVEIGFPVLSLLLNPTVLHNSEKGEL